MSTTSEKLNGQIERIKRELLELKPMRPGSVSRQYRDPKEKQRPFYQISYTHRMKSRSEYLRPENLDAVRREVARGNLLPRREREHPPAVAGVRERPSERVRSRI